MHISNLKSQISNLGLYSGDPHSRTSLLDNCLSSTPCLRYPSMNTQAQAEHARGREDIVHRTTRARWRLRVQSSKMPQNRFYLYLWRLDHSQQTYANRVASSTTTTRTWQTSDSLMLNRLHYNSTTTNKPARNRTRVRLMWFHCCIAYLNFLTTCSSLLSSTPDMFTWIHPSGPRRGGQVRH